MKTINLIISAVLICISGLSHSVDLHWDGKSYPRVGVEINSDNIVRFPEPVSAREWLEKPEQLYKENIDESSYRIRARTEDVDQRWFAIGQKTGTAYILHLSSKHSYAPLFNVINKSEVDLKIANMATKLTPIALFRALFRSNIYQEPAPTGFAEGRSEKLLLHDNTMTMQANKVWQSTGLSSITATVVKSPEQIMVKIDPATLDIRIPSFGDLIAISADSWTLTTEQPSTNIYFIFSK